jgi:hypothetical protein
MGEKSLNVELFVVDLLVLIWLCAAEPQRLCTGVYVIVRRYPSNTASRLTEMCWVSHIH